MCGLLATAHTTSKLLTVLRIHGDVITKHEKYMSLLLFDDSAYFPTPFCAVTVERKCCFYRGFLYQSYVPRSVLDSWSCNE